MDPARWRTETLSAAGNSGLPAELGEQEKEEVEGKWAGGRAGVIGDCGVPRGAQVGESSLRRGGREGTEVAERERERERERREENWK